jgi:hypothetical protein
VSPEFPPEFPGDIIVHEDIGMEQDGISVQGLGEYPQKDLTVRKMSFRSLPR